jgi:hypothetical protein
MSEPKGPREPKGAAPSGRRSDEGATREDGASRAPGGERGRQSASHDLGAWHDLVTASLIGTERAVVPAAAIPGLSPMDDDAGDPAALLLDRAALLTAARRAGRRPDHAEPLPTSEPDPRPTVSAAAGRRLARMLGGDHSDLLGEWLRAVTARGLRLPPEFLPVLLDLGRRAPWKDPALVRLVAEAGGPRARWLAGLNPDWQFVLGETRTENEVWRLGTTSQRRAYLRVLRARDQAAARELIADGWAAAGPDERVMFVNALADGPSLADESLLEAALDDGTAGVRKMAADVLAALPGSAFSQRMAERAVRWLRVEDGERGPRLVILPPAGADAAMRRDGITSDLETGTSQARRIGLVLETVARTPLQAWTRRFGLTPQQIVGIPSGDWDPSSPSLFMAWSRAALTQGGDQEWVNALVNRALTGKPPLTAAEIGVLRRLIRHADPRLGAPDVLPHPGPEMLPALWQAIRTLRFRYEMLKELDDDHGNG